MLRCLHALSRREITILRFSPKLREMVPKLWKASVILISCQTQSPSRLREHPQVTLWQLKDSISLKATELEQSIWTYSRWTVSQWARNKVTKTTIQLWAAVRKTSMLAQLLRAQPCHRLHLAVAVDVSEPKFDIFQHILKKIIWSQNAWI